MAVQLVFTFYVFGEVFLAIPTIVCGNNGAFALLQENWHSWIDEAFRFLILLSSKLATTLLRLVFYCENYWMLDLPFGCCSPFCKIQNPKTVDGEIIFAPNIIAMIARFNQKLPKNAESWTILTQLW